MDKEDIGLWGQRPNRERAI